MFGKYLQKWDLNIHLFKDDSLSVRGTTKGRRFVGGTKSALLEVSISPLLLATVSAELAGGVETSRLAFTWTIERERLLS